MEEFTTSTEIISLVKEFLLEDGYILPSDSAFKTAVTKARKVLKPKYQVIKNVYYYEKSFMKDAVLFLMLEYNFQLQLDPQYVLKQKLIEKTKAFMPLFDFLIASAKSLELSDETFNKNAWFTMWDLYNLSHSYYSIERFHELQLESKLEAKLIDFTGKEKSSLLVEVDEFTLLANTALADFDKLIIEHVDENYTETFYNMRHYQSILNRLLKLEILDTEIHSITTFDKETIEKFVSEQSYSSIKNEQGKIHVKYVKGNGNFWKRNV